MASRNTGAFTFFDVVYEDGTRRSNRKVPSDILGGLDGDEPARTLIEGQDEEIAKASGKPRPVIAELSRSPVAKPVKVPFGKKK